MLGSLVKFDRHPCLRNSQSAGRLPIARPKARLRACCSHSRFCLSLILRDLHISDSETDHTLCKIRPLFSQTYTLLLPQPLWIDIHTNCRVPTPLAFKRVDISTLDAGRLDPAQTHLLAYGARLTQAHGKH
jgi:hypothetical protein